MGHLELKEKEYRNYNIKIFRIAADNLKTYVAKVTSPKNKKHRFIFDKKVNGKKITTKKQALKFIKIFIDDIEGEI